MRKEGNPLDLNTLPEDNNTKDGKQTSWDTSSSADGYRKKKRSCKDQEKDEGDGKKVYECRFCSLKFCKSQALGGHMNRHRQERETETLNKARQLVFTNDLAPVHLGYVSNGQPISSHGGYNQYQAIRQDMENAAILPPQFRPMYPPTILSTSPLSSPSPPPQPPPAAVYTFPSPQHLLTFPSQYQAAAAATNDYFVGHALSYGAAATNDHGNYNYTCIGAPVGHGLANAAASDGGVRDVSLCNNQEKVLNWGRR